MAAIIKFPLKMTDGAQVKTIEELREHFDLADILRYYDDGRLYKWLKAWYYDDEAEKVEQLDSCSGDFKENLCAILGVSYLEDGLSKVDLKDISKKNERLERLKQFTADDAILAASDRVAFTQEELESLLDRGVKEIYLCGERFKIPEDKEEVIYIGVHNPLPILDVQEGFLKKNIIFNNVNLTGINDIVWRAEKSTDPDEAICLWHMAAEQGSAEAQYRLGVYYYNGINVKRDYIEAMKWIHKSVEKNHLEAKKTFYHNEHYFHDFQVCIAADSPIGFIGLRTDGTVVEYRDEPIQNWRNIIAVSGGSEENEVGLKKDGTVVVVGRNTYGQCDTQDWHDIIAISASSRRTVGLKKDGTVVAVGGKDRRSIRVAFGGKDRCGDEQCDVQDWSDIIAISAGDYHVVGLKKDGTVVAVGENQNGQCDVQDWSDIIAISANIFHTVGLKKDGTVVAVGMEEMEDYDDWIDAVKTEDWHDIIAISAGATHTIGLKKDGTVVAVGENQNGQCDLQNWCDIIAVSAGNGITLGLRKDGTMVVSGELSPLDEKCRKWDNIGLVLSESEFKQECNSMEAYDIIEAVGGVENICTCDLTCIEKGIIEFLLNDRYMVDVPALQKVSEKIIAVKTVIEKVVYDNSFEYMKVPFWQKLSAPQIVTKLEDRGKGVVNIQFFNIRLEMKNEFESILPKAKIGALDQEENLFW